MVMDHEADEAQPEKDPISVVRRRPGMFFGSADGYGKLELLLEVASNGVDQYLQGNSTLVRIQAGDNGFQVWDDGAGLDRVAALKHLTEIHFTPTADHHAPHIHLGGSGVGLCPVNAVSRQFVMQSSDAKGGWKLHFERGRLVDESECEAARGTLVHVSLDLDVLSDDPWPLWKARRVLFDAIHLFPGLRVEFNGEVFHAPKGLEDLARFEAVRLERAMWREDDRRNFGHVHHDETLMFTLACYGTARSAAETVLRSWVNGLLTPGHGSHVDGVLDALKTVEWSPAAVMLSVVMKEPQYAGPTRDKLDVDKVRGLVREAVIGAYASAPPIAKGVGGT